MAVPQNQENGSTFGLWKLRIFYIALLKFNFCCLQYKVQDFWSSTHKPEDSQAMIRSFKATMGILGMDFGPTRLPIRPANNEEKDDIRRALDAVHYYDWAGQ